MRRRRLLALAAWVLCTVLPRLTAAAPLEQPPAVPAGGSAAGEPLVAIVIDDVGEDLRDGRRAIALPGPVALSFLPYMDHTRGLALLAHRRGKDVMLHLPMQAMDGRNIGRGGLTIDMTQGDLIRTVGRDLAAVPYAVGINNHMGSLATRHPGLMHWLMSDIRDVGGLFFIDSRTTDMTVAQQMAVEAGVANLRRDVFLDDDLTAAAIDRQFDRLLALARRHGWALAIGHPHPVTLTYLERRLPQLSDEGVRLVPVPYLVRAYGGGRGAGPERLIKVHGGAAALPASAGLQ